MRRPDKRLREDRRTQWKPASASAGVVRGILRGKLIRGATRLLSGRHRAPGRPFLPSAQKNGAPWRGAPSLRAPLPGSRGATTRVIGKEEPMTAFPKQTSCRIGSGRLSYRRRGRKRSLRRRRPPCPHLHRPHDAGKHSRIVSSSTNRSASLRGPVVAWHSVSDIFPSSGH